MKILILAFLKAIWILKKFFDANLIYNGLKILPYCPRCGTGLASHEVAQGYKDVKEKSVFVRFKKADEENWSMEQFEDAPSKAVQKFNLRVVEVFER